MFRLVTESPKCSFMFPGGSENVPVGSLCWFPLVRERLAFPNVPVGSRWLPFCWFPFASLLLVPFVGPVWLPFVGSRWLPLVGWLVPFCLLVPVGSLLLVPVGFPCVGSLCWSLVLVHVVGSRWFPLVPEMFPRC